MLVVCLVFNWLCAVVTVGDNPHNDKKQKKKKKSFVKLKYDGGKLLMALTNTLMIVQTGFPTGVCEVCSRENDYRQGQGDPSAKHIGQTPRGRPSEPHHKN